MLWCAGFRRTLGFLLVVIGLIVLDDVILAAEEGYDTWEDRREQSEARI